MKNHALFIVLSMLEECMIMNLSNLQVHSKTTVEASFQLKEACYEILYSCTLMLILKVDGNEKLGMSKREQ